jgi:hypothetical protein
MPLISQNVKPRAEQEDFFTWEATLTAKKPTNGAILIISTILKHMISSAVEAEISVSEHKRSNHFTHNFGRNGTSTTTNTTSN